MQIKQMYAFDIEMIPLLSRKHLCRRDGTARALSLLFTSTLLQRHMLQYQPEVVL